MFTLRGLGLPDLRSRGTGDHHIVIAIEVPTGITGTTSDLLAAFGASIKEAHHPRLATIRKQAQEFYERRAKLTPSKGKK